MHGAIDIQLALPKAVAEAWLASLRSDLRKGLTDHWYDDCYRAVPEPHRSRRILEDYPALAGHKHTIGALKAALAANL